MRKIIIVAIAIVTLLAMAIPAMADPVTTTVTVGGGGQTPVVKCKWEQEPDNNIVLAGGGPGPAVSNSLESGDKTHVLYPAAVPSYSQFVPPLIKGAKKQIDYYAVVPKLTIGSIQAVFALVFHPLGVPSPYNNYWNNPTHSIPDPGAPTTEYAPYFKYKVEYSNLGSAQVGGGDYNAAVAGLLTAAYNAHLIKFTDAFTYADALDELQQGLATLWMGSALIDYEQPAGDYKVDVYGMNSSGVFSVAACNYFNYVPTCGIEVDFNALTYGSVGLGQEVSIGGDQVWNTPLGAAPSPNKATVRNIGNTWTHVTVSETDMNFGWINGGPSGSAYTSLGNGTTGPTPPTRSQTTWNVYYDTQMGFSALYKVYFTPNTTVTLPNYLGLSMMDKLDFSIFIFQGGAGLHTGSLTLGCTIEPFGPVPPASPSGVPN